MLKSRNRLVEIEYINANRSHFELFFLTEEENRFAEIFSWSRGGIFQLIRVSFQAFALSWFVKLQLTRFYETNNNSVENFHVSMLIK